MRDTSPRVTAGVDTHRDQHVVAALDERGAELKDRSSPTTPAGHRQLLAWLCRFGAVERCGVDGIGAYGASLTRYLHAEDVAVVEVNRSVNLAAGSAIARHCRVRALQGRLRTHG